MEDRDLVRKARKMDVYLEDIPTPRNDQGGPIQAHYETGSFGNQLLFEKCRWALTKAIHERMPSYRKERREVADIWLRGAALIVGLLGSLTGLIAILKK